MILNIKQDHNRFRDIVKGKIKSGFKKYISQGEMIGKRGKDYVSIPLPTIEIPHFQYGPKNSGGVGQGEGENGTPLGGDPEDGDGNGKVGNDPGQHRYDECHRKGFHIHSPLPLRSNVPRLTRNTYAMRQRCGLETSSHCYCIHHMNPTGQSDRSGALWRGE